MPATVHVVPAKRSSVNLKVLAKKLSAAKKSRASSLPSKERIRAAARKLVAKKGAKNALAWKIIEAPHHGSRRSLSVYPTKQAAIDQARKIARNVIVHGGEGQIIQKSAAESRLSEVRIRDAVRKILRNG